MVSRMCALRKLADRKLRWSCMVGLVCSSLEPQATRLSLVVTNRCASFGDRRMNTRSPTHCVTLPGTCWPPGVSTSRYYDTCRHGACPVEKQGTRMNNSPNRLRLIAFLACVALSACGGGGGSGGSGFTPAPAGGL